MDRIFAILKALAIATLPCALAPGLAMAQADVDGVSGAPLNPVFNLTTGTGYITSADGGSIFIWGYGLDGEAMQYPGPTLIVNEGDTVTVNLTNTLPEPVSIIFPGQEGVSASGDITDGLLTEEAAAGGGSATYSFVASHPGTFMYQSGTNMAKQVEMGLVGALIVRPSGFDISTNRTAYGHPDSAYEHEYLFLLTEMDSDIHEAVEYGNPIDTSASRPNYWFINGRTAPDTLFAAGSALFPHQPYNIVPRTHPGERVLMRVIGAGRYGHPFHHHGNNSTEIARDGRLLESAPGAGADLSFSDFTIPVVPGGTYDAIFEWTGEGMGWDIYGTGTGYEHGTCDASDDLVDNRTGALTSDGFHDVTWEYCPDHNEPFPVTLPGLQDLAFGGWYSGSPYLGISGSLPPGEGGLNPTGAFYFMWHSHNEKEMVNFDVFPGGMMTMFAVEANGVPIP